MSSTILRTLNISNFVYIFISMCTYDIHIIYIYIYVCVCVSYEHFKGFFLETVPQNSFLFLEYKIVF